MIRLLGALRAILLTFALVLGASPAPAAAQIADLNTAINKAGRQRMLSQRMAKAYLQIGQGVDTARSQRALDASIALFDRQLVELKNYAPAPEIRATYQTLERVWLDYKDALVGSAPSRTKAADVLRLSDEVLALAHQGTEQLEKRAGTGAGRLVNLSGRQRMAKLHQAIAWKVGPPDRRRGLPARPQGIHRRPHRAQRRPGQHPGAEAGAGTGGPAVVLLPERPERDRARAQDPRHQRGYHQRADPGGDGGGGGAVRGFAVMCVFGAFMAVFAYKRPEPPLQKLSWAVPEISTGVSIWAKSARRNSNSSPRCSIPYWRRRAADHESGQQPGAGVARREPYPGHSWSAGNDRRRPGRTLRGADQGAQSGRQAQCGALPGGLHVPALAGGEAGGGHKL